MRKRGQGTVYKRGNIYWIKYYRNGVPYYESTESEDRLTAERALAARQGAKFIEPDVTKELSWAVNELLSAEESARGTIGAISEMMVAIKLMNYGYDVFRSISPHASCDLIACKGQRILRVEVKTTKIIDDSVVPPTIRNKSSFDVLALVIRKHGIVFTPALPEELNAGRGTRTLKSFRTLEPKSSAFSDFAMPAEE